MRLPRVPSALFHAQASAGLLLAIALVLGACGRGGQTKTERLYSTQNEELDVYDLSTGQKTVLIPVTGWVNGQICPLPDGSGSLLMAEDKNEEQGERSGWTIFSADGAFERKLPEPKSSNEPKSIDPMGCAFDNDKRLFATDVGEETFDAKTGKLILFFPPDYKTSCILDSTLRAAGSVAVDDDGSVLVAEAVPPGRVLRFSPPFPESAQACDATKPTKSTFIEDPDMSTPLGLVRAPNGNWYVASVFIPPAINEYGTDGKLVRNIIKGQDIGNPSGVAVASDGTIYYADLGLVTKPGKLPSPERGKGTVRKVVFDKNGNPKAPQIIGSALSFPDGLSVLTAP